MKDSILDQIKKNKPDLVDLPEIPKFPSQPASMEAFMESLQEVGAKVVRCDNQKEVSKQIKKHYPDAKRIANTIPELAIKGLELNVMVDPKELHPLDLSIIRGAFGVVENGAIWINPDSLKIRAIPFIGEHLVIVLSETNIIANMHQAYDRLEKEETNYGVFIAGPSKTADIEQCLVIGAQGARSLLVVLMP